MSPDRPLAGRTVLVTGATRGIGAATARAVHRDGAHVIAHYGFNHHAAQQLLAELGDRATAVCADLRVGTQRADLWEAALRWRGSVDVLVNNAGAWLASPLDDSNAWAQGWAENLALDVPAGVLETIPGTAGRYR
jgi:3-oxoacyl-[acyl-carrier protein] reductase